MTNKPFERWQVVRLVSGGPKMVVLNDIPPPKKSWLAGPVVWGVFCQWFDVVGRLHSGYFDPEVLRAVK